MLRPLSLRFSLLVSAAGIMALSACDTSNLADKITGREGRKEQIVDGPRRSPLLNPRPSMMPPEAMPKQPMPAAPKPQAVEDSPFDQFDDRGSAIAPVPAKPLDMTIGEEDGSVDSGFFDRFVPDRKAKEPAAQEAMNQEKPLRKPFIANLLSDAEPLEAPLVMDEAKPSVNLQSQVIEEPEPVVVQKPEPAPEAKQAKIKEARPASEPIKFAKPVEPAKPILPLSTSDAPDAITGFVPLAISPAEDKPAMAELIQLEPQRPEKPAIMADEEPAVVQAGTDDSKPSLLSRIMAPVTGEQAGASKAGNSEPYPELSSVPPTPESFKAIKETRDQQIESLKQDHAQAQAEKETLAAEPSELAPPSVLVGAAAKPAAKPELVPAVQPIAKPSSKEPVLLGRVSDPELAVSAEEETMRAIPAPIEYKEDTIAQPKADPVAQPIVAARPEAAALPASEPQPWWRRLGALADSAADRPDASAEKAAGPAGKQMVTQEPVGTAQPFKPLLETKPAPAVLTPIARPAQVPLTQKKEEEANEEDAAGEPQAEPVKAEPAKTLPPSRYSPPRQRQYYLVP